jgi:DNA helicase-2/ATP-dependent DNA helicase PcrA
MNSINSYEQPVVTGDVQKRIDGLINIANSIEQNLVKPGCNKSGENSFKIDYENSLNEAQYLAATTIDGPLLVIAGAGSGKTRTVVYRVAYLLENGVPPQEILLLTFTRKAAEEMLARTSALLNDMRCQRVVGGTFHSVANNLLRRYSKLIDIPSNFTIIDTIDSEDILDLIRRKLNLKKRQRAFPRKSKVQTIISKSRNCNTTIEAIILREFSNLLEFIEDIRLISKLYAEYKQANNIFDFDDLMKVLRDSLRDNPEFRERIQNAFQYVMVDEFQDTNTTQKEIVDLIAARHRNIMVVGDDSQSIYSFRGANFENILRFPETYPDCKVVKIEQNYRSNQGILNFTNSIMDNILIGYRKKLLSINPKIQKPVIKRCYNQENEAEYIVSKIRELRRQNIPLNEIAVLYRASFHGNYIQLELLKRNIPFVVYGGIRFMERRHVKDILAYLRIVQNPTDAISWNRVLRLIPGVGNATASKIIQQIQANNGRIVPDDLASRKYSAGIERLQQVLNQVAKPEIPIHQKIEGLKEYYLPILKEQESNYESRLLDIDVVYSLACKYEDLEQFLSDFALDPPSDQFQDQTNPLLDKEPDRPLVLSTIHSAKGLEWNNVFIPYLLDGVFPSTKAISDIEGLEEERRLFYVACTRAKEGLYLSMPSYISFWDSFFTLPSRFIAEISEKNYELLR